jgi:hypothetical protein
MSEHQTWQVRVNLMLWIRLTRSRLLVDRHQPYFAHQSTDPFASDFVAKPSKVASHLPPIPGRFEKLLVDQAHERPIQTAFVGFPVVEPGVAKTKKTALPDDTEPGMAWFDHPSPLVLPWPASSIERPGSNERQTGRPVGPTSLHPSWPLWLPWL